MNQTEPIAISSRGEKIQVLTVIGKFHLSLLADVHKISQATDMEEIHFTPPRKNKNKTACASVCARHDYDFWEFISTSTSQKWH